MRLGMDEGEKGSDFASLVCGHYKEICNFSWPLKICSTCENHKTGVVLVVAVCIPHDLPLDESGNFFAFQEKCWQLACNESKCTS